MRVYEQRLRYFTDFLRSKDVGDTGELTGDHLKEFIVELRQRDAHQFTNHRAHGKLLSTRTVFHYARIIKSFGEWLPDQEILPRNPFAKVKLPRVEKKLMPSMPVQDMVKVYDVIRKTGGERTARDLALYCFMLESGARATFRPSLSYLPSQISSVILIPCASLDLTSTLLLSLQEPQPVYG